MHTASTNVMQRCSQTCIFLALRFHFSFSDEMHRVKLRFSPSGSNYINASYIHVRKLNSTAHTLSALFMCYFLSRATNALCISLATFHVINISIVNVSPNNNPLYLSCPGLPTEARVHSHSRSPGAHHWRLVEDGGGE